MTPSKGYELRPLALKFDSHLFKVSVVLLLVPNILPHHVFVKTNGGYKVPAGPKVFASEIPLLPFKMPGNHDRALPFHVAHRTRYRFFGRNT